jgi:hypothetical protein
LKFHVAFVPGSTMGLIMRQALNCDQL